MSSSEDALAAELATRFGDDGLRRFDDAAFTDLNVPEPARADLLTLGIPVQVGPYFAASTPDEPVGYGAYAQANETIARGPLAGWAMIGSDGASEICVANDGSVQSSFLFYDDDPGRMVNSDVRSFVASLLALDEFMPVLVEPGELKDNEVYKALRGRLIEIDEAALADSESWWPRVLEDLRHEMSFAFSAAVKYTDDKGEGQIVTARASVGGPHPEELLYQRLAANGVDGSRVIEVYTELQPCMMPGHYCALKLGAAFPNANFTYRFDYPDTAQQRQDGLIALIKYAAAEH
jgi:hypothetical protein